MNAVHVLDTLSKRGLSVSLSGSDLKLEGPRSRMDPALIAAIRQSKAEIVAHLRGLPGRAFAATPMQQSYFYGRQAHFALGNVSSHVYREIEGVFDAVRLETALAKVIARHGPLRTVFLEDGSQIERPPAEVPPLRIPVTDLRGRPEAERTAARLALRAAMSHQVLPADRAPLIDIRLTILADDAMVLHVSHDGLVMDGVSAFLFFHDWRRFLDEPELPAEPLAATFQTYVEALEAVPETPAHRRARDHWLGRLEELPPPPQLPLRVAPETLGTAESVRRTITLPPDLWRALRDRAAEAGLTPTALLTAAYAEVLSLWGGGDRFTLNLTLANRLPVHPQMDALIGNFTDCLLLPVAIEGDADFKRRALALQDRLREALEHRQFSGIEVMRALGRRSGATRAAPMPFTVNSTLGAARDGLDGSAITAFGREVYAVSQTPQVWVNLFLLEADGALVAQVDSVDALFPDGMIDAMVSAYGRLLEALAAQEAAWRRADHELLPADQAARRREANRTDAPIPAGQAHDAFLDRARRMPEAAAIVMTSKQIRYGELRAGALAVARRLIELGVRRNEPVAVVASKGWEQIVGILGTVVAGAAYLPVDAGLPDRRIAALLADGNVRCTVVQGDRAPAGGERIVVDDAFLDAAIAEDAGAVEPAVAGASPDDLAYVLYTSGSTGAPKGVMISHRSVVNLVTDINRRFAIGPADRLFAISSASFDLSVFDLFGALSAGAALVIPDAGQASDPAQWLALADAAGVSVWNSVPAIVGLLVDEATQAGRPLPSDLRLVMMSGDRIPVSLPPRIRALKPDARIVSLGGPTETTVWNILHPIERIEPDWTSIPYGRPNANNRAHILDHQMRACPDHVPGDLYAAGAGLAVGYWGDPQRTAERFFLHEPLGERLYRTGDVACYRPDGEIEILGRSDFQIKLNGYRIETGEIETLLDTHPAVMRSAVVLGRGADGLHLVACLAGGTGPDDALEDERNQELRRLLADQLPDYMVPRRFVWFDRLPLTGNGKVDRMRLQGVVGEAPPAAGGRVAGTEAAKETDGSPTALEQQLLALWSELLKTAITEPTCSFFQMGGTSLSAIRLLARIRKEFGVSIPLTDLPRLDNPRVMAAHLERAAPSAGGQRP